MARRGCACDDRWREPEFLDVSEAGTSGDDLIETNITDDIHQTITAEEGVDVVHIGLGDTVDVRTGDSEFGAAYGDDVEGEEGDRVVVCIEDIDNATRLGTRYVELFDEYWVEVIDNDIPIFGAELGSNDTLEVNIPNSEGGALYLLEGEETDISGSGGLGPVWRTDYGFVLYSETGAPPPLGLETDEDIIWFLETAASGPLGEHDLDGFYVIGRLDLGSSCREMDEDSGEEVSWREPVDPPAMTLV